LIVRAISWAILLGDLFLIHFFMMIGMAEAGSRLVKIGNSFAVDEDGLVAFIAVRVASGYSGRGRPKKPKEKDIEESA
jgi:hypothetical protein